MRVAITSHSPTEADLHEAFQMASRVEADGLELAYPTDASVRTLYEPRYPWQLSEFARSTELAIPSIFLSLLCNQPSLIGGPDQLDTGREVILQALSVAGEAGVPVVVVPFLGKNTIEVEDELTRATDALHELIDPAEHAGVVIAVASTLNFTQQRFLLDNLGNTGDVKMSLDTAAPLARKLDLPTGIRELGKNAIAQVRLRDVRMADGQPPDDNVDLGEGDVDFAQAIQALRAVGYDGWIAVKSGRGTDTAAAGEKNVQFARNMLTSLE